MRNIREMEENKDVMFGKWRRKEEYLGNGGGKEEYLGNGDGNWENISKWKRK